MKDIWDFVEANYPNYSSSDEILLNEDLQKIVEGDISGSAKQLFKKIKADLSAVYLKRYGKYLEKVIIKAEALKIAQEWFNRSNAEIYRKSIEGFINKLKI